MSLCSCPQTSRRARKDQPGYHFGCPRVSPQTSAGTWESVWYNEKYLSHDVTNLMGCLHKMHPHSVGHGLGTQQMAAVISDYMCYTSAKI